MRVLATWGAKGGVGKTAGAVHVAHLAACSGLRVLLWDLDPQGAAAHHLRVRPAKGGSKALVTGRARLLDGVRASDHERLDVLPADRSARRLEVLLHEARKPGVVLRRLLGDARGEWDLVVLDAPPGTARVAENVVRAADLLLTPVVPSPLAVRTLAQARRVVDDVRGDDTTFAPYFSLVDRRRTLHRQLLAEVPPTEPGFLVTVVPLAAEVERAAAERRPVTLAHPRGRAARAYRDLWVEAAERVGLA